MNRTTLLRTRDVKKQIGYGHTTLYAYIQRGLFTRPVKIGLRASAWPAHEVEAINNARIAGKSADEIKVLVNQLHEQRKLAA